MTPTDAAIAQAFREYDEGDIVQLRMILARARELDAAKPEQVHTCSYYCDRPECLKAQRDELRDRLEGLDAEKGGEDDFVMLCHDGQPCKKLYGPTEYPTPKAATPPPNWCRTCGKHWSDPMAVLCSDGIHNPNKPTTPPAQAAEAVRVTKQMCYRAIDAYTDAAGEGWQQPCVKGMYAALDAAIAAMQAGN